MDYFTHTCTHIGGQGGGAQLEVITHGECFLALALNCKPWNFAPLTAVKAVLSTPHSCLTTLCPTRCSHASTVLPKSLSSRDAALALSHSFCQTYKIYSVSGYCLPSVCLRLLPSLCVCCWGPTVVFRFECSSLVGGVLFGVSGLNIPQLLSLFLSYS